MRLGSVKKMAAAAAAIIMVLGMSSTVFAATVLNTGYSAGVVVSSDTTLNIPKTLVVKNPALAGVAGPGLQLTYTVAPATVADGTVITDGEDNTAPVHPGPVDGLRLVSSPTFTVGETLDASAAGADNVKNIVLEVDLTKFNDPGIYRYELTDTTTADALAAAGVDRDEHFDNVRYVDVYVQEVGSDLVVEGYVVGSDADEDGLLAKETFDTSTTDETSGTTYPTKDLFETYNASLTKSVTGTGGERHNQFPFAIAVSDSSRAYYADKGTAPSSSSSLNQAAHTTALSTTLQDTETYYIAGLTKNDTVAYTETNNTDNTYSVSVTGDVTIAATNVSANGGTKVMPATDVTDAGAVTFVNNLGSISPTGVITRFGPYIGMLAIAGILIFVRRRAKDH